VCYWCFGIWVLEIEMIIGFFYKTFLWLEKNLLALYDSVYMWL